MRVADSKQIIQVSLINNAGIAVCSTSGKAEMIEAVLNEQLPTLPVGVYVLQVRSGTQ